MAKRMRRGPVTLDADGNTLGGGASGSWGDTAFTPAWFQSSDPNIMKAIVPTGTPPDTSIVGLGIAMQFPDANTDTWYAPTTAAISEGKTQAALDTIQATGAKIVEAGGQVLDIAATVTQNLPLILLGLGALYLFLNYGGQHHAES